jgi:hypothetical protein
MSDFEWQEPEVHYSPGQWLLITSLIGLIWLEFEYMWTWCQWFTHCPK